MKGLFFWATAVAVAGLITAACDSAANSTAFTPTGPSANSGANSGVANTGNTAQNAAVVAACGLSQGDDGTVISNPGGGTPPSLPRPDPGDVDGGSPGLTPGPAPVGADLVLVGQVAGVAGSCPGLTLALGPTTVRTSPATSFPSGSCSSIKPNDRIGAVGINQADGTMAASCVTRF